ncbi:FecR domain-containing protein [Methylicorpusculum sp.]|uniref:FecR domain-containing protein n=1 Tax=Methylicorpusculum sp. TaxID=2713644 RepID=UPI00271D3874|nr:FecR domain-containing protein [Methylicorpusculum sp.]MDO8845824.1 TonB-dependent receptor [Methylicorpusculum sp.]
MNRITQGYLLSFLFVFPCITWANGDCEQWIAKLASGQGKVDIQHPSETRWLSVEQEAIFCPGDKIRTGRRSRATLLLSNQTIVTLDQNSTLIFSQPEEENIPWLLKLLQGSGFFRSRQTQQLNIHTPFINAVHEGTEFLVEVDATQTQISVFDGQVTAQNQLGKISITQGYTGFATENQAPRIQALTIKPEDAVQWSLYYPPIIDDSSDGRLAAGSSLIPALEAYRQGHSFQSLAALDALPVDQHNVHYLTLKAALLLTVGRVDEAEPLINQAQQLEPTSSDAFAIKAVIAVAKNQQQQALEWAKKAVTANPESSIAKIAESYAYQSLFNIDEALKSTQEAVKLAPDNALAWARLTELHLSMSDQDAAFIAAEKANQLNPQLARTRTLSGFANLARTKIERAKADFEQALTLDSSDPLARLGLGLSKIRKGDIEAGKTDLETAVNLDPNNSVLRSYLGKAYYELRNTDYASTEYKIAKAMDPKDPTPWFYDALLKQTTNRPVEALHDMQQAIELNDNRGVYRSKLLLDEDAAARTANLARIYNDLGFGRTALKEAWKSLGYDSTNHSAHRFLSDAYIGQPRYRTARASELLQAQLLQPINITPVQPQLTSENIGILNSLGPGSLSMNEYDPMYTSNGAHLLLNGAYGSSNTITDNAIISGVYNNLSGSLGQFHYETDGFRQNDGYQQDIYNAFLQYTLSPDLSVQLELKSDDVRAGDVPLRANGFHQENLKKTIEHDIIRAGGHYRINPVQDLIASGFYTTLKDVETNTKPVDLALEDSASHIKEHGYQTELQYIFHPADFDITTGFGYMNLKTDQNINTEQYLDFLGTRLSLCGFQDPGEPDTLCTNSRSHRHTDYINGYVYSKQYLLPNLTTLLGFSYDSYDDSLVKRNQFNPKFGVTWNPFDNLTVRSAVFRSLTRPLASNQTIEPTQVAGFNQFFDSNNGTTAWQGGFGLDYTLLSSFFLGGEVTWRDGNQTVINNNQVEDQSRNEASHLAYFYWTPVEWMALRSEYRFEKLSRDYIVGQGDPTNPRSIETQQVPLSLNLFHDSGFFTRLSWTHVYQRIAEVAEPAGTIKNNENFWTFDAVVGYRLPKKIGLISFEVRNVLDNDFNFQSTFDASGPQLSPFIPERQLFGKLSLFY